jgi:HAMP domain-containing protein
MVTIEEAVNGTERPRRGMSEEARANISAGMKRRKAPATKSPLEAKAAELESLATEIRELGELRKTKVARFGEVKAEFQRFLASVNVAE